LCFFGEAAVWLFCRHRKPATNVVEEDFSRGGATAQRDAAFQRFSLRRRAVAGEIFPWHGRCEIPRRTFDVLGKGKLIMKTVVSFLLGAVMLFGAATLGLQSATANAKDRHDQKYWRHHRHHRHYRHRKNHLSY
jgi:hypothetical protein